MIIKNVEIFRNLQICYGIVEAGDTLEHPNSEPGNYHSHVMTISGSDGHGTPVGGIRFELPLNTPVEVSDWEGIQIDYQTNGDFSTYLAILPNPKYARLSVQKGELQAGGSVSKFLDRESTVLPYRGSITIDGQLIEQFKAATVTDDRTVQLTADSDVSYLIVTPTQLR